MPTVFQQKVLPYAQQDMFSLVDDVDAYDTFLPWCSQSTEKNRCETNVEGTLFIKVPGFTRAFTTKNTRTPFSSIDMQLIDGPFRYLNGTWSFKKLETNRSLVTLKLDFEFSNRMLTLALGPVFSKATQSMLDAFSKRAKVLYDS